MIKELNENPIAWILHNKLTGYRTQVAFYPGDSHEDNIDVIPLYTAPPKRESLTPRQGLEEYKKGYARAEIDLKREPLSDEDIFEIGYKAGFAIDSIERDLAVDYGFLDEDGDVDNEPYFKLVRAIEKAHGIGCGNE